MEREEEELSGEEVRRGRYCMGGMGGDRVGGRDQPHELLIAEVFWRLCYTVLCSHGVYV